MNNLLFFYNIPQDCIRATNVEGFVHNDLKVTLENLYRLQHDVLHNKVDAILWDIVKEQKVIH